MVRLVDPKEGYRIYDPCCGSGGMLIYARKHVGEHGGNSDNLSLFGQDNEGSAWAICKMNLILHGVFERAFIENDDTLTAPQHLEGGELMRFDRILSNPPFSMPYEKKQLSHQECFTAYGFPTEKKKADFLFALHMIASLRPGGIMATVMPHGVFQWLAWQPGYKSRFQYSDAEYFNLSDKDTRIATAQREQKAPTLEQIKHVINTMPADNATYELINSLVQ
jgi:type I restriction-modification system DNA methylase subunit